MTPARLANLTRLKRANIAGGWYPPAEPAMPTEWDTQLAILGMSEKEALEKWDDPRLVGLRNWAIRNRLRVFLPEKLIERIGGVYGD